MQFLLITKSDTLQTISRTIGSQNIDALLAENGLRREPKIGKQWNKKCDDLLATQPNNISAARKSTLLNAVTDSQEVFEKCCLLDEDGWKIFSAFQAFRDALRIPESIRLPYSSKVIGATASQVTVSRIGDVARKKSSKSTGTTTQETGPTGSLTRKKATTATTKSQTDPISSATYRAVMRDLKQSGQIKAEVFNKVNTSFPVSLDNSRGTAIQDKVPQYSFPCPWGKIQMYSTLLDKVVDFPVYPEQVDTTRSANYVSMPETIYQYEPWIMYESSGPREQNLTFHMHRDLWSGNHLDGKANELIRFCEANTFPRITGSTVNSSIVKFYIDGALFISGVLTRTDVHWEGPIGLDNWYLDFELTLTIQEISTFQLNIDTMQQVGLIGV